MVWKALFGKPEQPPVSTIADLRAAIDGLPADLPIFVLRAGHTAGWVFESPRQAKMRQARLVYDRTKGWVRERDGRGEPIDVFVVGML